MSRFWWIVFAVMGVGLVLLVVNDAGGDMLGVESDVFGPLLYLGVLGAVIAAGILRSRNRMGETARALALWTLVVLVLIAGYQYRYELQDVASRVTAGLVPGSPLSVGEEDGRATVTLQKLPNGHFGAQVSLDGTEIDMIVDTGATATILTADDAARAGSFPDGLRFDIPVSTANGRATAARAVAEEASIGGIVRDDLPLLIVQPGQLDQSLLGMNFIGTLSGFDVRGDRMILRD